VFGHIRMANHLTVAFVGWIPPVADQEGGRLLRVAVIVSQNVRIGLCSSRRFRCGEGERIALSGERLLVNSDDETAPVWRGDR
jgi:hypothetical protein